MKRVAFWKVAGLDYERDPFCAERWGKNYNSWMGDETSSAAASMHTFVGSWRLFQFPCGEKLPLRHWPPSAFLVRVDSCVETKALICLALWAMAAWRSYCEVPQPKLFPASIVYIGTTAVGGAPSMPGMAWGCQNTQREPIRKCKHSLETHG